MSLATPSSTGFATNGSYRLRYEVYGSLDDPVVLLINGLGSQMLGHRVGFCAQLVDAGFCAIRFDNRDVGESSKTHGQPPDSAMIMRAMSGGEEVEVPYSVVDMAADGVAVLNAAGVDRAHVWGMSMGGMIAQTMAFTFPDRLHSLTSVMSTTGDPEVGQASSETASALVASRPTDLDEAIAMDVAEWELSAGDYFDEVEVTAFISAQYERCDDPRGRRFQLAAVANQGDRTAALATISMPTTVIHGAMDILIPPSGGEATAAAIPGAKLVIISTMGHDAPEPLWGTYVAELIELAARVPTTR